jgi:phosphomannomutase
MGDCVRNNSTTHLLDRVAESFGQKCHEVSVGFKHVSGKMAETGAIIGGESSGGMAVKGHIPGKDGIYAAALLVEMRAVTGKTISGLYREIVDTYGQLEYEETSLKFDPARRTELKKTVYEDRLTPDFGLGVERITFGDGCKVVFTDGSWVICRFSGTEPLLRIAAEGSTLEQAKGYVRAWKEFLEI